MKGITGKTLWNDTEAVSLAAAHFFIEACHRHIAEKGSFVVALSGGNTPKRLYQLLASPAFTRNIPWEKVFLFWSDERFVAPDDKDSNYRMVKENLLDHIPIPVKNIFPVPIRKTAAASAAAYEKTLRSFFKNKKFKFDWLLLGLGEDGHTASLFPGTAILKEHKKLVKEVWVEDKKSWRISFTLPLINKAAAVIFLVTGKEKAPVVAGIFSNRKKQSPYPAQLVKPAKGVTCWLLDKAASGKL